MSSIPIKRFYLTTDQSAPWEGVAFTCEVGSDELAEALKACFPQHRNLRERKHAAAIQFLTNELLEMSSGNGSQSLVKGRRSGPGPEVGPKDARGSVQLPTTLSAAHSPATSDCSSSVREKRDSSVTSSTPTTQSLYIDPSIATHSSQFVFNATDGRTMPQKSKRKMTAKERIEYKETRKRGACSKCKRLKGKVSTI